MSSIRNIDLRGDELEPVLIAHLESDDFFFAKMFPEARFTIKSAKPMTSTFCAKIFQPFTLSDVR